ncbi:sensor histidine kinase [Pedobacter metabolipauper]|nr:sensor histidine kinase [Pedobacter metabolipauper]
MSFPLLFMNQDSSTNANNLQFSWVYVQFPLVYILIFYTNAYYLFPKFYVKKKYILYTLSLFILLAAVMFLKPFDQLLQHNNASKRLGPPMPPPMEQQHMNDGMDRIHEEDGRPVPHGPENNRHFDILSFCGFVMVIGLGTALSSIKEWQLTEKRAILAEADRANAELSFLKAQINPHFLYNTLNNIYTLSITGSPDASDSIMKLSNIMRYVTDEAQANFVTLQDELDCIGNFIDLQKLRLGKKVILNYTTTGNPDGHQISPLILMTFIENVFKYGLSNHEEAPVTIAIDIEPDKINFFAQNRIFKNRNEQERNPGERRDPTTQKSPGDERTGLGIKNTKQRLDHLYAQKYSLKIDEQQELFTVKLILHS